MRRNPHFAHHADKARDLGLTLAWIAVALIAGVGTNVAAIWFGAGL